MKNCLMLALMLVFGSLFGVGQTCTTLPAGTNTTITTCDDGSSAVRQDRYTTITPAPEDTDVHPKVVKKSTQPSESPDIPLHPIESLPAMPAYVPPTPSSSHCDGEYYPVFDDTGYHCKSIHDPVVITCSLPSCVEHCRAMKDAVCALEGEAAPKTLSSPTVPLYISTTKWPKNIKFPKHYHSPRTVRQMDVPFTFQNKIDVMKAISDTERRYPRSIPLLAKFQFGPEDEPDMSSPFIQMMILVSPASPLDPRDVNSWTFVYLELLFHGNIQ